MENCVCLINYQKNALFQNCSKGRVGNVCNQEATRHASCLYSLSSQCSWTLVSGEQPNCLCSQGRGYVKEQNIFRKTVTDLRSQQKWRFSMYTHLWRITWWCAVTQGSHIFYLKFIYERSEWKLVYQLHWRCFHRGWLKNQQVIIRIREQQWSV